jgi:uncharacterized protein (DUF1800 family)
VLQIPKGDLEGARERAAHLLGRIGFGPRPGEIDRLADKGDAGLAELLERQLFPAAIADPEVDRSLAGLSSLALTPEQLYEDYPPAKAEREAMDERRRPVRIAEELAAQKLLRAVQSERQLEEVLVDFWFNHFNVDFRKGAVRWLITPYERDAIRPHVFGRFRDLLEATATSPAMLFYLDNWLSVREGWAPKNGKGPPRGINENYARELLELHTLGVGGYSQQDVVEVARAFTGWSVERPREGGPFVFRVDQHDFGPKSILGRTIPAGGGREDGEAVLDLLAAHPATARFVATKLCRRLVSDEPPEALIERVARAFLITGGDLRWVYLAVLTSPEFWSKDAARAKVKTPFEFVASALRGTGARFDPSVPALGRRLAQLGMPLYECQPPTGYSEQASAWVNPGALVARINFSFQLAGGKIPGVDVALDETFQSAERGDLDALARMLGGDLSPPTKRAILAELEADRDRAPRETDRVRPVALLLGSPDFQRR